MKRIFNRNSLRKEEALKSRKSIAALFSSGEKIFNHPVLVYFQIKEHERPSPVRVAFSVSKRKHKNAADRNRIKRYLRETYRVNKHSLLNSAETRLLGIHLMLIYVSEAKPTFQSISVSVIKSLDELQERVNKAKK